ncbi:unnamed protein product [Chilo suppressalis]|uniref:CHK kinase-like domain-containing protein n=1 Tax=Chilo suppressalis TaxID=168631 RepID=A0ABN8B0D5_CHISP|nr:unnamed protein product [Chilo suppressalis]
MAHAEETLLEVLRSIARDLSYQEPQLDIRAVTSGGANYTSKLYLATISSPGKERLHLFAKIGSFSEKIRTQVNVDQLFRTEHLIYTKLVKIWDSIQEKYQVPDEHRYVFPKYYGGNLKTGCETVVLEDLTAAGYSICDRFKPADWEHAAKSIEALAKFHALSFVLDKEDPDEYKKITEQLKFLAPEEDESMKGVWLKMVGGAVQSVEEGLRDRVIKFFESTDGRKMYLDYHMPRGRPVLIVGSPSSTMAHAEETLLEMLRSIARDLSYQEPQLDIRAVTSGGANHSSKLYLATISSPGKERLHVFAKIGSFSEKIRKQVNIDQLFRTEHLIYTKLVKIWDSIQEKYKVPDEHRYVFPKYYGGNLKTGCETVVLEDLTAAGYSICDRFKPADWEHAAKSIEMLAKFHALSFILDKEDPDEYKKITEQLKFLPAEEDESVERALLKIVGDAVQLVEEGLRDRVIKFFESTDGRKMFLDYHMPRGRPVLAHGDYKPSNLATVLTCMTFGCWLQMMPTAMLLGAMILPVVLVEEASAPRTDSTTTGLDSFVNYSYSARRHFDYTNPRYGYCITRRCKQFYKGDSESELIEAMSSCLNHTLEQKYGLRARIKFGMCFRHGEQKYSVTWLDLFAAAFFFTLMLESEVSVLATNTPIVMQTFFFMSGLFLVYTTLISNDRVPMTWRSLPKTIFLRWLRIAQDQRQYYQFETFNYLYKRTHTNIPAFGIGMLYGLFLYKWMKNPEDTSKYKSVFSCGVVVITFIFATVLWLLVEAPCNNLGRTLFPDRQSILKLKHVSAEGSEKTPQKN